MLQLNHVTITKGNRDILRDCTFQFEEGKIYVILGDQDDCITLFNCMCKEKKTDDGEIVTWDGMSIYNASDDSLLPHLLTGEEYLSNLTRISGSAVSMEEAARDAGLSHEELKDLIENHTELTRAKIRLAAMPIIDPYIMTFGAPFPEKDHLCGLLKRYGEEKVLLTATSDPNEAVMLVENAGAVMVCLQEGYLKLA
ncbi:MAG: hypothetical protein KHZ87_01140 [Clostridiales bacterium]|nr:hypothetical protein [Clostridiales bacterium]MBS5877386.1 hypothetical protein [Clostridiales bacterium]MDU0939227.1 hypothetical protein [Clostridiales bacterium]MDU1042128.1 hypothetical protein [Clostridiales bacterium]MDU3490488.1 hypothetical protein [Clostridiales bacterium]